MQIIIILLFLPLKEIFKKTWETEKALQRQLEERSGIFPYQDIRKSHQRWANILANSSWNLG